MISSDQYIVLTGATGLLGQYLLRDLLDRGHRVAAIVRGNKKASPAQRLERTMQVSEQQLDQLLPRPICLAGDITKPHCGLSDEDRQWVSENCDTMMHCAASLTFNEVGGEPWRTNVEGTNHVLDLCRDTGIKEMHYISTAYVCGHRTDLVHEDELDVGQEFRNDYEKSKFLAEKSVRAAGFDSLTIYRPVVITGDSKTGFTSTYHGTYLYMKLAKVLAQNVEPDASGIRHISIRWGLTGDERRNITPVDWNSEIICQLYENPTAHGRTFHLAPQAPMAMRDAIGYATDFYGITGIEFHGYKNKPPFKLNELERWVWANISIYGSYDFMDPRFDMTNLLEFAPTSAPPIDVENAWRLLEFAEKDRWGKHKDPPPEAPLCDVADYLNGICPATEGSPETADATSVGLDVLGPGGGQWRIGLHGDRVCNHRIGLPSQQRNAILRLPVDLFVDLIGTGEVAAEKLQSNLLVGDSTPNGLLRQLATALFPPK